MILIAKENNKPKEKNEIKESEPKDKSIFVKVSDETRGLIDKYKTQGTTISDLVKSAVECYNNFHSISPDAHAIIEKFKEGNESNIAFIERAIKYYGDQKDLDRDIWVRARDEMKMMLIGKTTFNQLIAAAQAPEDRREKPWRKNVGIDIILWYNDSRPLKSLSIEEILKAIQKIWLVANYFHHIDIKKEGEDEFHMLFRHRQNKRYSTYWLGYFTELFNSEDMAFKCAVEGTAFDETLSITIKVGYEK
ncbi:MAG: hypothetical protein ACW986_08815 [Promethearchaeota archaeon]|jgi:hypothetical protein